MKQVLSLLIFLSTSVSWARPAVEVVCNPDSGVQLTSDTMVSYLITPDNFIAEVRAVCINPFFFDMQTTQRITGDTSLNLPVSTSSATWWFDTTRYAKVYGFAEVLQPYEIQDLCQGREWIRKDYGSYLDSKEFQEHPFISGTKFVFYPRETTRYISYKTQEGGIRFFNERLDTGPSTRSGGAAFIWAMIGLLSVAIGLVASKSTLQRFRLSDTYEKVVIGLLYSVVFGFALLFEPMLVSTILGPTDRFILGTVIIFWPLVITVPFAKLLLDEIIPLQVEKEPNEAVPI